MGGFYLVGILLGPNKLVTTAKLCNRYIGLGLPVFFQFRGWIWKQAAIFTCA